MNGEFGLKETIPASPLYSSERSSLRVADDTPKTLRFTIDNTG